MVFTNKHCVLLDEGTLVRKHVGNAPVILH